MGDTSPRMAVPPLEGSAEHMADELRAYAREGIGHVQLVVDPITEASVAALAPCWSCSIAADPRPGHRETPLPRGRGQVLASAPDPSPTHRSRRSDAIQSRESPMRLPSTTHQPPCGGVHVVSEGRTRASRGMEVSDLDKRIIEHLQEDGRRPFTQIAADLGVSEAAVRARTNRLIEKGILQIVGVTDPLKVGFHQWAMIGVKCQADRLIEVAEEIAAFPETDYVVVTAGTYDMLVEAVAEDNEALLCGSSARSCARSRACARPRRSSTCA